ncbi:DNA polymerase zeta [Blastocladiella emersonii ATCC 22665]|nr:DNA polymerase zeta [Blastocladiella emersonii ATCC 22665]
MHPHVTTSSISSSDGSAADAQDDPHFMSIRIASLDHVLVAPGPLDRAYAPFRESLGAGDALAKLSRVPVIRIFGLIKGTDQRACVHVHGVYPYLLVPYLGDLDGDALGAFIQRLGLAINAALSASPSGNQPRMDGSQPEVNGDQPPPPPPPRPPQGGGGGGGNRPWQMRQDHVIAITPVRATPFYGYHAGPECFLKIWLANPDLKSRLAQLLASGAVLHTPMQPHEAHLPYLLQFLADHAIDGMGWMDLDWALFRMPVHPGRRGWMSGTVPLEIQWNAGRVPAAACRRTSRCDVEIDTTAAHIANYPRRRAQLLRTSLVTASPVAGTAGTAASVLDNRVRIISSLDALWADEAKRRTLLGIPQCDIPAPIVRGTAMDPWDAAAAHDQELDAMFQQRKRQVPDPGTSPAAAPPSHATVESANVTPDVPPALLRMPWIQDTVGTMWARSLPPGIARAGTPPVPRAHRFGPTTAPAPVVAQEAGDVAAEVAGYPDLVQFTQQLVAASQAVTTAAPTAAAAALSQASNPEIDVALTQDLLEWMLDQGGGDTGDGGAALDLRDHGGFEDGADGDTDSHRPGPWTRPDGHGRSDDEEDADDDFPWDSIAINFDDPALAAAPAQESEGDAREHDEYSAPGADDDDFDLCSIPSDSFEGELASSESPEPPPARDSGMPLVIPQYDGPGDDEVDAAVDPAKLMPPPRQLPRKKKKSPVVHAPPTTASSSSRPAPASASTPSRKPASSRPKKRRFRDIPVDEAALAVIRAEAAAMRSKPKVKLPISAIGPIWSPEPPDTPRSPPLSPLSWRESIRAVNILGEEPMSAATSPLFPGFGSPPVSRRQSRLFDAFESPEARQADPVLPPPPPPPLPRKRIVVDLSSDSEPEESPMNTAGDHVPDLGVDTGESFATIGEPAPSPSTAMWYLHLPPTPAEAEASLLEATLPLEEHAQPYYGNPRDAHLTARTKTFAGRDFKIPLRVPGSLDGVPRFEQVLAASLPPADAELLLTQAYEHQHVMATIAHVESVLQATQSVYVASSSGATWTTVARPPTRAQAVASYEATLGKPDDGAAKRRRIQRRQDMSQIELLRGGTNRSPVVTQQSTRPAHVRAEGVVAEKQHLLCMGVELHTNSRGELLPDPAVDEVQAIVYVLYCDAGVPGVAGTENAPYRWGILMLEDSAFRPFAREKTTTYPDEQSLLRGFIDLVHGLDPDVVVGYELHSSSWGYLVERCHLEYKFDLCQELSRILSTKPKVFDPRNLSDWGFKRTSSFTITGRLILNVWRLLKSEVASTDYTIQNMCASVLKRRMAYFPHHVLTRWYASPATRERALRVTLQRALTAMELLVKGEYLDQTAEFARVFGIEFSSVLTRGSQYRVESMLIRIARPLGFTLASPTKQQVALQRGSECLPLVLEPESAFYPDPIVILDFQSLYPSIMIGYNFCFSTCLGKLVAGGQQSPKLGFMTNYSMPPNIRKTDLAVSPNGIMFAKTHVRGSIIGKMLSELLDTRIMIKQSMKLYQDNKQALTRMLHSRQLGLKLIANVTYGYCAASFSGRMPMVELGDSVVQAGRETLEKTIRMINAHPKWGGRVVYGDTDSVFVVLRGATKERAFAVGHEIAAAVTRASPSPVELKFAKVYLPSILVTKKRYVGYSYESLADAEPAFDDKGIETVRRDGCPAVGKIMRSSLEILFKKRDLSLVKEFVERQFTKLLEGRVPLSDLIIAKAVKLGSYSERGLPPPGAYLALRKMKQDPRAEPQYGERVPYLVAYGEPGDRLIDQIKCPREVLRHLEFFPNAHYYITKQVIPALERLFKLFGADIAQWYADMPKPTPRLRRLTKSQADAAKKFTLDRYYTSSACVSCDKQVKGHVADGGGDSAAGTMTTAPLCAACRSDPRTLALNITRKLAQAEQRFDRLARACLECTQLGPLQDIECESLACPVLFDRVKAKQHLRMINDDVRSIGWYSEQYA